jgi:hypothetical protein
LSPRCHQHSSVSLPYGIAAQRHTKSESDTDAQLLYRLGGKQPSASFEDLAGHQAPDACGKVRAKAPETLCNDPNFSAMTVVEWIQHLTGLRKSTPRVARRPSSRLCGPSTSTRPCRLADRLRRRLAVRTAWCRIW